MAQKFNSKEEYQNSQLYKIRHTCEHIFNQAVEEIYPGKIKRAIGPAIEDGWYNDAHWDEPLSDSDFEKIEKRMQEIIDADLPMIEKDITENEARELFHDNSFKQELITEFVTAGDKLTVYYTGDPADKGEQFVDLCRGPHVKSTGEVKAFKLLSIAGAYWRGDSNNEMLTRVYGTAFESKEDLEEHLKMLEEAKKRDHRKLGKELDLFTFSELVGSGLPLFTPRGTFLRQRLANYSEELQKAANFEQVWIPHMTKTDLYKVSGHWDKFGKELFLVKSQETSDEMVLKPMNCPHHAQIYASQMRSYRDLPQRYYETTTVYRDEKAGELSGLSRVRSITQDDAHIFCRMDQIEGEFRAIMGMIKQMYGALGLEFRARLSFRDANEPEKYHGDDASWENAQKIIEDVAKKLELDYFIAEGEAAFYGPKIDIMVKDSLGREWQCATEQLDFVQPKRFGLKYIDKDGSEQMPVMIHKALLGSIERFLNVYIEHTAGNFPLWLSYKEVEILAISNDKHMEYAESIFEELKKNGIRAILNEENETLGNRIRKAQANKIPYVIVVGDKEKEAGNINVRMRGGESLGEMKLEEFIARVVEKEKGKALDL
jgi:threonyl-tRNA synthetase